MIWQGTADVKVNPANARELVEQWTNVHGIRRAPAKNKVKGYPHAMYKDDDGKVMVETYTITGMKHAVPVNLGSGADHCGVRQARTRRTSRSVRATTSENSGGWTRYRHDDASGRSLDWRRYRTGRSTINPYACGWRCWRN